MTSAPKSHVLSQREALYALSMGQRLPDTQLLNDLVRQFPHSAEELTEFAIEIVLDALRYSEMDSESQVDSSSNVSPVVSRAISRFYNCVYSARNEGTIVQLDNVEEERVENPFESLSRAELRMLAARVGVNTVFIIKLRDRQIHPDSIPERLKHLVSRWMRVPIEVIDKHFAAGQVLPSAQFYKADIKPLRDQRQSYSEAIAASGLTEEEQRRLLDL